MIITKTNLNDKICLKFSLLMGIAWLFWSFMNLGFIGTGKIASSIIFGIFKSNLKINKIYISSRNRNIAKKLKGRFSRIKICSNNQEIIDKASVIFLSVTPLVGKKILNNLSFKAKQ